MVFGPAVDSKQELQRLRNVKYSVLIFKKSSSFDPYLTDFITQLQFYTSAITSLSLSGILKKYYFTFGNCMLLQ